MPDIKKMFEICNYVIKNSATIMDVCEEFDISRRTAQKYTGEYLREYANETEDELAEKLIVQLEEIKCNNEKSTQTKPVDIDLEEVIEYIISVKSTVEYASLKFGISESTIRKYISSLKNNNPELYERLKIVQEEIIKFGNIVGGKNGVRGPKYTDFESVEVAETMLGENLTLSEASEKFDIPRSTIYERVKGIDDADTQDNLQAMFDSRKKRK